MKTKNLIAILTILITVIATAQDRGPGQRGLILEPIFGYVNLTSEDYPFSGPDSLVIGFQWPNNLSVANGVYANHNALTPQFTRKRVIVNGDTTYPIDSDKAPNGAYMTLNGFDARNPASAIHSVFSHNLQDTAILHVHSMTWETNMQVNPEDNQYQILAKRPSDQTRPIFGMGTVYGNVPSSGANYSFLEIPDASYIDHIIFRDPWGSEYLWRS
ncbi:MAG: hypothetical protein WCR42_16355 [bacterium]